MIEIVMPNKFGITRVLPNLFGIVSFLPFAE
jgi:hypothetical protein